jgi:hypothetical protein
LSFVAGGADAVTGGGALKLVAVLSSPPPHAETPVASAITIAHLKRINTPCPYAYKAYSHIWPIPQQAILNSYESKDSKINAKCLDSYACVLSGCKI